MLEALVGLTMEFCTSVFSAKISWNFFFHSSFLKKCSVCELTSMHTCMWVWRPEVDARCSVTLIFRQGLSLIPLSLTDQQAPGIPMSPRV